MSIRKMIALHPDVQGHVNQPLGDAAHHLMYCARMCVSCADACAAEEQDMRQRQKRHDRSIERPEHRRTPFLAGDESDDDSDTEGDCNPKKNHERPITLDVSHLIFFAFARLAATRPFHRLYHRGGRVDPSHRPQPLLIYSYPRIVAAIGQ